MNNVWKIKNGSLIDTTLDCIRDGEKDRLIYPLFVHYYDNIIFTKIKDSDSHSVYMAKIKTHLAKEERYLVCIVRKDESSIGTQTRLDTLKWDSFQTRTLLGGPQLQPQYYEVKRGSQLNKQLVMIDMDKFKSVYSCKDLPLKVTLLHTKQSEYEYPQKGNVISALETFQTIIVHT